MKTKKKSLKITTSFPPRMSELIETYAKNHKITLEQAVGDLVFNSALNAAGLPFPHDGMFSIEPPRKLEFRSPAYRAGVSPSTPWWHWHPRQDSDLHVSA